MVNPSIILRKISIIRECLAKLKKYSSLKKEDFLKQSEAQDVVLHNLMLAIQASIDLGAHLISDEGWGIPGTQAEIFRILQDKKVIAASLAKEMIPAVGLRNILVHEYEEINFALIFDVLAHKVRYFEEYIQSIIKFFKLS